MELKQSVAFRAPVRLVFSADGRGKTGLSNSDVTVSIQKQAGTSVVKTLSVSDWFEVDAVWMPGVYDVLLSASDTDTLGYIKYTVNSFWCDPYFGLLEVRANLEADTYNRIGSPVGASISADIASIDNGTSDLQSRLPATLNSGRIRAHVEIMDTDVIGASQIAAGSIGASEAPLLANLDATVSSRATQAQILSDATPFQGARIDASVASRAVPGDSMALTTNERAAIDSALAVTHGVGSWVGLDSDATADAVWNEDKASHALSGSFGEEVQSHATPSEVLAQVGSGLATYGAATSTQVATRAAPGDAMSLVTDAVNAGSLAVSAVDEIGASLSSDHGSGSWEGTSAAVVAAAVWDEVKGSHVVSGSFGEEVQSHATPSEVLTQVGSGLTSYGVATGTQVSTRAAPGDAMDLVEDAVDSVSLAISAVTKIGTSLSADHGSGSWEGISAEIIADAVWDETKTSHVASGSFGEEVQGHATPAEVLTQVSSGLTTYGVSTSAQVATRVVPGDAMDLVEDAVNSTSLADNAVIEINTGLSGIHGAGSWEGSSSSAVASAVWDEVKTTHTGAGSFGEEVQSHATPAEVLAQVSTGLTDYDVSTGTQVATRAAPGDAMGLIDDSINSVTVADSAVTKIDEGLSATHGSGSWVGSSASDVASAVWGKDLPGSYPVGSAGNRLANAEETISNYYTVLQSYSYRNDDSALKGIVWVEHSGLIIDNPTHVTVTWYSVDGVELLSLTDSEPDAQGFFKVSGNITLSMDTSYYAVAVITLPGIGVVSGGKGIFTVG
jgi:hypothetical protein